jgi:hypothetical protein
MEVHHHPKVEKKNFKEYFLEFIMIFLAVTLGFFAEQIQELFANKAKVKEYMHEIVENLKYDTTRCSLNAQSNIEIQRGLDSLRSEVSDAVNGQISANELYYYALRYSTNVGQVAFNTSAINELKSSGSLRLIENLKLLLEISDYYERKIHAAQYFIPSVNHIDDLQKMQNEIFSLANLDDFVEAYKNISEQTYDANYNYQGLRNHSPELKLLNTDPLYLQKFYTLISQQEIEVAKYNFWILYCKKAAEQLIKSIQKEYDLENG